MKALALTVVKNPVDEINELHSEMNELAQSAVQKAIRIGELLTEEHKHCKHGGWEKWLKANVSCSLVTSYRYIQLYQKRDLIKSFSVKDLAEAYRICLPARSRKSKQAPKIKPITIRTFIGTCAIDPLPSWHVVKDQNKEDDETLVCTKCWTHMSGGQPLSMKGPRKWIYQCHCPDSERAGIIEEYKKVKP